MKLTLSLVVLAFALPIFAMPTPTNPTHKCLRKRNLSLRKRTTAIARWIPVTPEDPNPNRPLPRTSAHPTQTPQPGILLPEDPGPLGPIDVPGDPGDPWTPDEGGC
ncbi:hypothetical protein BD410DRAFT_779330 [Rickenella mellea]|uniref:Uncharacterized protein n=1 Tax=Rickenella mellea TaxID=50990 RepID=A0A4R5XE79_9AGAM|nr:hypothetical protein BD410DRAFT_779330 [Rickenella mellea]